MKGDKRIVEWNELADHCNRTSLWIVIEGQVFDLTTYLAEHPGGDNILLKYGGLDGTQKFLEVNHTNYARSLRNARLVGTLTTDPQPSDYLKLMKSKKQKANLNPNRQISWEELEKHNKKEDLWLVIEGKVYDVTDFQDDHPGGPAILLGKAGGDATAVFHDANHSQSAYKYNYSIKSQYFIKNQITKFKYNFNRFYCNQKTYKWEQQQVQIIEYT